MEADVRKRISSFLENEQGTTVSAFAKVNGENQSKWTKQIKNSTAISLSTILLLLEKFPDLSAEWLLRGTGTMFLSPAQEVPQQQMTDDLTISSLLSQLETKDAQIAEKDKQLAAAQTENAKLLDLAKVKIIKSTFNDVKL